MNVRGFSINFNILDEIMECFRKDEAIFVIKSFCYNVIDW